MEEIWKDIQGYEGKYQVSNLGRVRSLDRKIGNYFRRGKVLKACADRNGYLLVNLYNKYSIREARLIHRLVANAFILNRKNKLEVNHIDGNKHNNAMENLEWCTSSENKKHAIQTGLKQRRFKGQFGKGKKNWMYQRRGKDNPCSKVVIQYNKKMDRIAEYGSTCEAERKTGICSKNIAKCCRKEAKTAGGYIWRYKEE